MGVLFGHPTDFAAEDLREIAGVYVAGETPVLPGYLMAEGRGDFVEVHVAGETPALPGNFAAKDLSDVAAA